MDQYGEVQVADARKQDTKKNCSCIQKTNGNRICVRPCCSNRTCQRDAQCRGTEVCMQTDCCGPAPVCVTKCTEPRPAYCDRQVPVPVMAGAGAEETSGAEWGTTAAE